LQGFPIESRAVDEHPHLATDDAGPDRPTGEDEMTVSEETGAEEVPTPADGALQAEPLPRPKPKPIGKVAHFTPDERTAHGKAARADVPRSVHAEWEPPSHRRDPVELLEEQAETRVPDLVPIRYGRMLTSPFAFYRGGAYLMASDLAGLPRTGLKVQLCGDAHLSNFGGFAAPDRRMVFSLNDFDETLPGPFEWDVKRLVASFAIAGRSLGFDDALRENIALTVLRRYREAIGEFATQRSLDTWYARLDLETLVERYGPTVSKERMKQFERNVAKARTKDSIKAFAKLTTMVDGQARIIGDPPLIVPVDDFVAPDERERLHSAIRELIRTYRRTLSGDRRKLLERFRYVDMARKVVGVGSVGTRAWILLLLGRDDNDPLFLQAKEAQPSVLEPFLGKSEYGNAGQRVVEGQRLMQSASDIMLGWLRTKGLDGVDRDFYIRQLWDSKFSPPVETMDDVAMKTYAELCGWTLARAHSRSGDAVAIAGYLGKSDTFDRAVARFAELYADQNERDFEAVSQAAADGRIEVVSGL
jgi:uncharacterized protein (DUF2252 family)